MQHKVNSVVVVYFSKTIVVSKLGESKFDDSTGDPWACVARDQALWVVSSAKVILATVDDNGPTTDKSFRGLI